MQALSFDPLELLSLWWRAEKQWTPVQAYPAECPSTRGYRASRQYDDGNGAAETDSRGVLIRHISGVIHSIEDPHRTALYLLAKNKATGADVWRSERLPADSGERAALVADAVALFIAKV
jgi:hypothetical protein